MRTLHTRTAPGFFTTVIRLVTHLFLLLRRLALNNNVWRSVICLRGNNIMKTMENQSINGISDSWISDGSRSYLWAGKRKKRKEQGTRRRQAPPRWAALARARFASAAAITSSPSYRLLASSNRTSYKTSSYLPSIGYWFFYPTTHRICVCYFYICFCRGRPGHCVGVAFCACMAQHVCVL